MPAFTTRDGAKLHYLDVGRGRPCVMLHAFGMRASMWLPFVLPHASRRRFILLDFRGFGRSRGARLSRMDVLSQNADDLHDLLGHVRVERPKLAAFSIGAGTALAYQRRYGLEPFEAYLHLDHTPCIRNKTDWAWGLMGPDNEEAFRSGRELLCAFDGVDRTLAFARLSPPLRRQYWDWFGRFFQSCFGQPWWQAFAWMARGYRPATGLLLHGDDWPVYLDCVRAFIEEDYDFRDSLRQVSIPLWVGVGARSRIFPPEGGRAMAELVPHAKIIEYGYAGHVLLAEAPARVALTLRQFLALREGRAS
jgi:non-heme chloroperoxidase